MESDTNMNPSVSMHSNIPFAPLISANWMTNSPLVVKEETPFLQVTKYVTANHLHYIGTIQISWLVSSAPSASFWRPSLVKHWI